MTSLESLNVAIVHDYLNQRGGAERVVLELSEMWPTAPIYTSLYRPRSTFPQFQDRDVRRTVLDRIPVDRGFRNLFPLYPAAFRSFGEIRADVVLASSSGWAHMVRSVPGALRVVYCHTPARWLWGEEYLNGAKRVALGPRLARPAFRSLRRLDRAAALGAHLYIANSQTIRRRIKSTYGIDAVVVPPPVDVGRFRPTPRGERLLVVSRLLPYKHVDSLIRAANRLGIGLDIVGDGPLRSALTALAGPTVALHGALDDRAVVELMQSCNAVCVAAEEDFGIVAVEAQAAGKPVIAYGRGGSLETVQDGITGVFFSERTEASIVKAFAAADRLDVLPDQCASWARQFARDAFRRRMRIALGEALARRASGPSFPSAPGPGKRQGPVALALHDS